MSQLSSQFVDGFSPDRFAYRESPEYVAMRAACATGGASPVDLCAWLRARGCEREARYWESGDYLPFEPFLLTGTRLLADGTLSGSRFFSSLVAWSFMTTVVRGDWDHLFGTETQKRDLSPNES
jgi:hypothetical protein